MTPNSAMIAAWLVVIEEIAHGLELIARLATMSTVVDKALQIAG